MRSIAHSYAAVVLVFGLLFPPQTSSAQVKGGYVDTTTSPFRVEPPVDIMTMADRRQYGFCCFPDVPMGVVRNAQREYFMFGPGSGGQQNLALPKGTYKFRGTLEHFSPALRGPGGATPSMMPGLSQPSPDGSDFDRDYAGGGATYFLSGANHLLTGFDDKPQPGKATTLLHLYHGEYHYDGSAGRLFYGGIGMAVSYDYGDSFIKIGEILAPHMTRDSFFGLAGRQGGVSSNGAMIEADDNGRHVDPSNVDPGTMYYYILATDRNSMQEPNGLAIARVKKADAIDAIARQKAPLFKKYYVPAGQANPAANSFTEPGVGGRFTLIVGNGAYLDHPQVLYDSQLKKFILCDMERQRTIVLRVSDNLFHWSEPVAIFNADSGTKLFYPSVVGEGLDPSVPGKEFFVYFVRSYGPGPWRNATLMREKVTIVP